MLRGASRTKVIFHGPEAAECDVALVTPDKESPPFLARPNNTFSPPGTNKLLSLTPGAVTATRAELQARDVRTKRAKWHY
ncbi:hypothetical protein E2C01_069047 [Portunus trituberculatus]|uniref:Uncharacterized protein n=1 Tax=Portunus trituberculatus TaxID=210409 RepID=A0A5B7HXV9_PORTR|nr:hypothetical protein [Portunus trituberculatus]